MVHQLMRFGKKDKLKIESAKLNGFEVLIIWDSEYKKNKNKTIQKCLKFLKN
jgi:very-short-patch-repair endonuclease